MAGLHSLANHSGEFEIRACGGSRGVSPLECGARRSGRIRTSIVCTTYLVENLPPLHPLPIHLCSPPHRPIPPSPSLSSKTTSPHPRLSSIFHLPPRLKTLRQTPTPPSREVQIPMTPKEQASKIVYPLNNNNQPPT